MEVKIQNTSTGSFPGWSAVECAAVEQIWHIYDNQGQILALAWAIFQANVFETL